MSENLSCHCGNVKIEFSHTPEYVIKCNCTICSKLGTLWSHSEQKNFNLTMAPDATLAYIRDDEASLAFHSCKNCGCTTHWHSLKVGPNERMAVNMRLLSPKDLEKYRVRHFDGADKWEFLD